VHDVKCEELSSETIFDAVYVYGAPSDIRRVLSISFVGYYRRIYESLQCGIYRLTALIDKSLQYMNIAMNDG
jgi:hypothetical protein